MSERVKWGVMGNATIARMCVIPAIQKSRNGKVHALATSSVERAQEVAADNEIPHLYEGYEALIDDPKIEALYVPLPNHLHHGWTIKALQAGKHVLCEKPLACNAAEAQEMADAAEDAGRLLMEAFMYRFHPRTQRIKQLIAEGSIGAPCLLRSAFCYHIGDDLLENTSCARLKPEMGGGALLDVGCYSVSLSRWLLGAEPTQIQGQAIYHSCGVDVHYVGSLRFQDNALATLEASFISALQQTYSVIGSEGAIELPHDAFIPWEKDAIFTLRHQDEEEGREHVTGGADEYQLMVEHFADAVLGREELAFKPDDSVQNMRVLDALAESARSSSLIRMPTAC